MEMSDVISDVNKHLGDGGDQSLLANVLMCISVTTEPSSQLLLLIRPT